MDMNLVALRDFRDDFSACLYRRVDALFALAEALLTAGAVPSPVHLSGEPTHRRGWGSLYVALVHGRFDETGLRVPLATQPLAEGQPVYAVDCSVQARCDAVASPERGFYYHPSRHSAGQPIVAGWSYQWLAQVGFAHESWTALLDVRRVHPSEHANGVAVAQVARLVRRLPTDGPVPLFVFDAGYDAVVLQRGLADQRASILVRLRSGRCCYGTPPSLPPRPQRGRPFRHGHKLVCADPVTWPTPTAERVVEDGQYGAVRVRAWAGLHPKLQDRSGHGTKGPSPIVPLTLVLVEVCRRPGDPIRRRCSGCGGMDRLARRPIATCSGAPTSATSTWSISAASLNRPSAGTRCGCATPSRPIAGRGSPSPPTPSCVSPARWSPTAACPGNAGLGNCLTHRVVPTTGPSPLSPSRTSVPGSSDNTRMRGCGFARPCRSIRA